LSLILSPGVLTTEQLPVWGNQALKTAWIARCGDKATKILTIDWNPAETSIARATLVIPRLTSESCTDVILWVNNEKVNTYNWGRGTGGNKEDALDVTNLIHSGTNKFTAQLCDTICSTRLRPANAIITAYLEYEFTGEDPDTGEDPLEEFIDWLKKNWWVTIPILGVALISSRRR